MPWTSTGTAEASRSGLSGDGDPAGGQDAVPGPDRGGLLRRARRPRRLPSRGEAQRAVVRSRTSSRPLSHSAPTRTSGQSLAKPDVSAVEPPDRVLIADENRLDRIVEGFAEVIDAKSPWTDEHCDRVCRDRDPRRRATRLRRGRAARSRVVRRCCTTSASCRISNRILDKPGPLTDDGGRQDQATSARD